MCFHGGQKGILTKAEVQINLNFVELLDKDDTVTIHQRNLRILAIEMYKISNDLSPLFMKDLKTEICIPYNARSTTKVVKDDDGNYRCMKKSNYNLPAIKTASYGFESIRYLENERGRELSLM